MFDTLSDISGIDLRGGQVLSGFVSHHSAPPRHGSGLTGWQENNIGLGYKTSNGFLLVPYRNSENRLGALAAYEEEIVRRPVGSASSVGIRLGVGAAFGYKEMPIAPAAYPSLFARVGRFEVVLGHCVALGDRYPAVTWLQARYNLK